MVFLFGTCLVQAESLISTIDDFSATQSYQHSLNFGLPAAVSSPASAGILGGHRVIGARYYDTSDTNISDANKFLNIGINTVSPNRLSAVNSSPLHTPAVNVIYIGYDGVASSFPVTPEYGLGGKDLTGGGTNNRFELTLHKSAAVTSITLWVYSGDADDMQSTSLHVPVAGTDLAEQIIRVPFSDFTFPVNPVDFTAVTTIQLWVEFDPTLTPVEISNFRVAGNTAPLNAVTAQPNLTISFAGTNPVISSIAFDPMGKIIDDINLYLDIDHLYPIDLDMTLTSPSGKSIVISTDNGGDNENPLFFKGVLFDDEAVHSSAQNYVTDFIDFGKGDPSIMAAEQAMSSLEGGSTSGLWTLTISDDFTSDNGTLNEWGLDFSLIDNERQVVATTASGSTPAIAIPDTDSIMDTITVTNTDRYLCGIDFDTNITHTWSEDLEITITSPRGVEVALTTDNGEGNEDVFAGTFWQASDFAPPVGDATYQDGLAQVILSGEAPVSAFNGMNPSGDWIIKITDDEEEDTGTLHSWGFEYALCSEKEADDFCVAAKTVNNKVVTFCL